MDANGTAYRRFTDVVSDSTPLRKYHLLSLGVSIKEYPHLSEKPIKIPFLFLDFAHTCQPKQHILTGLFRSRYKDTAIFY